MNYPLYLARSISPGRGSLKGGTGRGRRGGAPTVKVAVAAVALSVAVMLAALAIVSGFKREITAKVTGFNAHISAYALQTSDDEDNLVALTPSLEKILDETPYVSDYSLQLSVPGIFKTRSDFQGIYFRSLEGKGINDFLTSCMTSGKIPDYTKPENANQVVISEITARRLGLKVGDRIDTYFMTSELRVRPLKVAAIFNSHFDNYDKIFAYGSLSLLQRLGELRSDQGTSLAIHTDDFRNISEYTDDLNRTLAQAYGSGLIFRPLRLENAMTQGSGYFHWLALLDTNVAVVLTLMTFVAIITLISGLLIIILDKKRFIGLLRALGAPAGQVRRVFIYLSMKITIRGLAIGNVAMLLFLWLQDKYHFLHLDPESYYIDFVPVDISWLQVLILNLGVLLVVWLSLILPSWLVARISPAETLRYE